MEDEQQIIEMLTDYLSNDFSLEIFSSLEELKENNLNLNEIDLVITDHKLIKSTAFDVMEYLKSNDFKKKVILSTGSIPESIEHTEIFDGILSKPYRLKSLKLLINEEINETR